MRARPCFGWYSEDWNYCLSLAEEQVKQARKKMLEELKETSRWKSKDFEVVEDEVKKDEA